MDEQQKTNNAAEISNNQFYTSATALQIRLNVEQLLLQLEMDIRGMKEKWNAEREEMEYVKVSEPLFSEELGIQNYMSYVRSVINVQIVQGNLDEDSYGDYMESFHEGLASDLIINRHNYGLSMYHYPLVIRMAINATRGFLTRLLGDKERQSYANTMKHVETSQTLASGRSFLGLRN